MAEPAVVRWVITAVFLCVTVTCLLRLASTARRENKPAGLPRRHEDLGHVVMAVGMIAMVLSWTRLLPTPVWVVLFGGQAVFFAAVLLRRPAGWAEQDNWDHTQHMMASIGMVYMVLALGDTASMAGMSGMSASPLAGAFGVYFLIYAVWSVLRATRIAPAGLGASVGWSGLPLVLSRPLAVHGCRALMGGGMAYLLLTA
ncbi:MAG TPA: DUF5134 domain-containing protein [Pseudonocardiaceae bacterium]|nr:DUF5134 domain-containing protein [Pseudonocardiaceae bacterium]